MPSTPYRVLIVDDDLPLRTLMRFALQHDDRFDVVAEAGNGREALRELDRQDVDLMLLDLAMPEMNGLELLEHLAEHDQGPPTIVLSAFAGADFERSAMAAGAVGFLSKGSAFDRFGDQLLKLLHSGDDAAHPTG